MKILITENKLNQLILNYLNSEFKNLNTFRIELDSQLYGDESYIIEFRNHNDVIIAMYSDMGFFYIEESLPDFIANVFGVDYKQSKEIIQDFIFNTYELPVNHVYITTEKSLNQ
jgi:hypothetical protein